MSVFNQSRSRVVQIIFLLIFVVILIQLINLQIFSSKYKLAAENNAIYRKIIYPDRGIIFDRKKKAMLENTISYDLVVTPVESKGTDTLALCALLNIDTVEYKRRMREIMFKYTAVKPSVFEGLLSQELYAKLYENMYKFPGFNLTDRSVRTYPFNTGAQVLGYIAEVDTSFLRRHKEDGYEMGDYAGMNGLERTYEKVLMGERGIKRFVRDNKSRIQGAYENGMFDTSAVAGRNLYTSVDVEVQQLAEKLLANKIGSAVAINPKTGGIIAMVSSPNYNPNDLTGSARRKNLGRMLLDTARPMFNRAIKGQYPPGSTFKPLGAVIALDEGLITPGYGYPCYGSYTNCGVVVKCEHKNAGHAASLRLALANSCNSYFSQVFRMAIDNPEYHNSTLGYLKWKEYMNKFGMGTTLNVDLPSENKASVPDTAVYNKAYGRNRWNSCTILTLGIGQDKMTATPMQLANMMCIIANKGYFYTPHFVDSIEHEQKDDTLYLAKYRKKHSVIHTSDTVFRAVHDGMHDVTVYGTASEIKVPGVEYCAKTGTAQNPHGKNHSLFVCFAPKDNPKIAVAVIVENAGYGATWAGPIGAFIMEKYLNDTIAADRLSEVERISKADLIPTAIKDWYVKKENQRQAKLILEAEAAKAEMNSESKQNSTEEEDNSEKIPLGTEKNKEQLEMIIPNNKDIKPILPQNKKDSSKKKNTNTTTALLIDENKKWLIKKSKA
jgi:penicillin-binding protein 2